MLFCFCFNEVVQSQSIGDGLETPECMGNVVYFSTDVYDNDSWRINETDISRRVNSKLLGSGLLPVNKRTTDREPDNCHRLMNRGSLNIFVRTFYNTSQVSVMFDREMYYLVAENEFKRTFSATALNISTFGHSETKDINQIYQMLDENLGRFIDRYKSANNIR